VKAGEAGDKRKSLRPRSAQGRRTRQWIINKDKDGEHVAVRRMRR